MSSEKRQQVKVESLRKLYKKKYLEGKRDDIILDEMAEELGYEVVTIRQYLGSRKMLREEAIKESFKN